MKDAIEIVMQHQRGIETGVDIFSINQTALPWSKSNLYVLSDGQKNTGKVEFPVSV